MDTAEIRKPVLQMLAPDNPHFRNRFISSGTGMRQLALLPNHA
jgi:hypothetical protein